jgi:hypothetical protein
MGGVFLVTVFWTRPIVLLSSLAMNNCVVWYRDVCSSYMLQSSTGGVLLRKQFCACVCTYYQYFYIDWSLWNGEEEVCVCVCMCALCWIYVCIVCEFRHCKVFHT